MFATNLLKDKFLESPWIAILFVCFLWWFLTGSILFLVNWADSRGAVYLNFVTLGLLPVLIYGFYGFLSSLTDVSVNAVYLAFISSLCIWGWFELAFLSGVITGPNRVDKPVGVSGFRRFKLAWMAIAYSEITLAIVFFILIIISIGEANMFGLLTFFVLYVARLSAKLNLFFGVPKINIEFLPARVIHLASHFKISGPSWFFPLSLIMLSGLGAFWLNGLWIAPELSGNKIGFSFLLTLTSLAILEHFFMIMAFPDAALWRWMIPRSSPTSKGSLK